MFSSAIADKLYHEQPNPFIQFVTILLGAYVIIGQDRKPTDKAEAFEQENAKVH